MSNEKLLRLPQVLERIPVSKSTFWAGIKKGKFPKPVKLTERTSAWRETEIDAICAGKDWRKVYEEASSAT